MAKVEKLIWDEWNEEHIGNHGVTVGEVEEACRKPVEIYETYRNRIEIVGKTKMGRKLKIVVSSQDRGLNNYQAGHVIRLQHMKKITKKSQFFVPEPDESVFRDREKEAKFWEENFDNVRRKPVKAQVSKNLKSVFLTDPINTRFDPETSLAIREEARKKGLGPTQLIRMWVMEKLAEKKIKVVV